MLLKSKRNEMSDFNQINLNTNYIKEHNSIWQQFGGFYYQTEFVRGFGGNL